MEKKAPTGAKEKEGNNTTTAKNNLCESEVCAIYGIGVRQLRLMRMRGEGPRWLKVSGSIGKTGGRILYPLADLLAWLDSRPSGGEAIERPEAMWPPSREMR